MTMTERITRTQTVLGAFGVVIGIWAYVTARGVSFTARVAPRVGWTYLELNWMSFNRLGAILVFAFSVVGLVAGVWRRPALGWIPAGGFALMALQVLVQWRPNGTNWLASNGPVLAFGLLLSVGFAVTAAVVGSAAHYDEARDGLPPGAGAGSK